MRVGFRHADSRYPFLWEDARQPAALVRGGARGEITDHGLREATALDGRNWVLFGRYPHLRGWRVVDAGAPPARILGLVRPLTA